MKILLNKKGISLAEVLAAIIVISIVVVAGFDVFSSVRTLQVEREIRLTAVNLAVAQMEHLKETAKKRGIDHSDLAPATSGTCTLTTFPAGFSTDDVSYVVETNNTDWPDDGVTGDSDYKRVIVTVDYPTKATADPRSVGLTGFVVE